jgi:hypothetical protein
MGWYDRRVRRVRDLSCGDVRVFLELEVRRLDCRHCGKVKRERLSALTSVVLPVDVPPATRTLRRCMTAKRRICACSPVIIPVEA